MATSCTDLLEALRTEASPLPWRKNTLGVTVDGTGEPVSLVYIRNEAPGILAVNHLGPLVKALEKAEHTMDAVNGLWGADGRLCCFCHATDYSAEVGIEHLADCAIVAAREALAALRGDLEAALEVK